MLCSVLHSVQYTLLRRPLGRALLLQHRSERFAQTDAPSNC